MKHPAVVEKPSGSATIETYTVVTDRRGKRFGIVVGRLADGNRFLANTPDDEATLKRMTEEDLLGRGGDVSSAGEKNIVTFLIQRVRCDDFEFHAMAQ